MFKVLMVTLALVTFLIEPNVASIILLLAVGILEYLDEGE